MSFDTVIINGTVVDGSGSPARTLDLGIKGDRVAALAASIAPEQAAVVIDATGLVVAPGFIDVHCHADWSLLDSPWDDHQERQGVTTQIAGLCGTSPLSPAEHFAAAEKLGLGINYGLMIGHGSVRKATLGEEHRAPDQTELQYMQRLVERAMDEGAFGLSTGLIYIPGRFAHTEELVAMVGVAARYGGVYATHMRSEGDAIMEALEEAIGISQAAGAQLQLSHIKVTMAPNWGRAPAVIERIQRARQAGMSIAADQYPYTVTGGGLYRAARLVPDWDEERGPTALERRCQRPGGREELLGHLARLLAERGGAVHFTIIRAPEPAWVGQGLAAVAARVGLSPEELCLDALLDSGGGFALVYAGVSEEELELFLRQKWVMVATDGVPGAFHPRTHGTFPRLLSRYVRQRQTLSLDEAVRRLTSLPADTLGLTGRGRLVPGAYADVVVFDPDQIVDQATLLSPHLHPAGIHWVLVNGVPVLADGQRTDARPGTPLLRRR